MAILMDHVAPNGASGNYFRINRVEGIFSPGEGTPRWEIWVGFYTDQATRTKHADPAYNYRINVPFRDLPGDPRNTTTPNFYSVVKNYYPFVGNPTVDSAEDSSNLTLDVAKATKYQQIDAARLAANLGKFPFAGKEISCDTLSRSDIDGVNGYVATFGTMPPNWLGLWKTTDPFPNETYVEIPTVVEWKTFYRAMYDQGQVNFNHSQALKTRLANCTSIQDVNAIHWGMDLNTPYSNNIEGGT